MERLNKITLLFKDPQLEREFQREYFINSLKQVRISLFLVAVIYALFAFLDPVMAPDYVQVYFVIRFLIVVPFIIVVFLLSFLRNYRHYWQFMLFLSYLLAGSGIFIMIFIYPENTIYLLGMDLVFVAGYFFIRLRYLYASVAGWALVLSFFIRGLISSRNISQAQLLSFILFYVAANLICTFGSYYLEKYQRKIFIDEKKLKENQDELQNHKNNLEMEVEKRTEELLKTQRATIEAMAIMAEFRDFETGQHIQRTQNFVKMIAEYLYENKIPGYEIDKDYINLLYRTAPLHDIGKVSIPDSILLKPTKLSKEEFETMKEHPVHGFKAIQRMEKISGINDFTKVAKEIIKFHHEKWDGTGYPEGLKRDNIPLSARIMALADVYDALISKRPYKEPFACSNVEDIIQNLSGTHFDPVIVDAFRARKKDFYEICKSLEKDELLKNMKFNHDQQY